MPLNGTFPYYSDGVAGEKYTNGDYKATNGRLYKVTASGTGTPLAWYPAPGCRHSYSGEPDAVGYYGFSWSSATGGVYGLDLYFGSQVLAASHSDHRAHGYPLRCLSHPQGVLLAVSTLRQPLPDIGGPAPGFRDAGNNGRLGALDGIGRNGYSWSSTVSSTIGMNLGFSVTYLDPSAANGRGYGFQLRCLSE